MLDVLQNVASTYQALSRNDSASYRPATPAPVRTAEAPAELAQASPRIQIDPVVGVILQFLQSSGDVVSQSPSFAAEAYLRAGLTADGFTKDEEHTQITA